jgi:hypothetical protein
MTAPERGTPNINPTFVSRFQHALDHEFDPDSVAITPLADR